ncbi:MAG: flagellar motor protein PomA [Bdellovibrionales bacterium]|nr:flagellar motor protein PomA [Bdellovibrionales bacterium]
MDLATVVGLIGGFGIVGMAIFTGGDFMIFVNIPSILIVVGGGAFAVMIKFTLGQFLGAIKVAMKAFLFKLESPDELIEKCFELAQIAKKGGPLALEKVTVENEFLKKGVDMLVDGYDPEVIKDILVKEKNLSKGRHDEGIRFFKAVNESAPAMGMIGTLIGLVQMLSNMSDPKSIGPAMAVAILTTLYGALISNLFAGPVSDKLTMRSAEEESNQALMIDAVLSIQNGLNPRVIRDALQNYIPKGQRKSEDEAGGGGGEKAA